MHELLISEKQKCINNSLDSIFGRGVENSIYSISRKQMEFPRGLHRWKKAACQVVCIKKPFKGPFNRIQSQQFYFWHFRESV